MRKLFGWLVVLLSGLMFLVLVGYRVVQAVERRSVAAERTGAGGPPIVRTVSAEAHDLSGRVEVSGTLRATSTVDVGAEVPGRVVEVLVDVGDRVKADAALARLDATELRLALSQAEGALAAAVAAEDRAKRDAENAEKLASSKAVTETQLVGARAGYAAATGQRQQAKAARDLAAERVRDATLRSPIAGVVTRASAEVGQTLAPGMPPPFQVQDDGAYEVDIGLDEATAYAIGPDQLVDVQVSARQQLVLPGRVQTVSSTLDRQTRKAAATVRLEPTTERLLTGTTVTVVLSLEPRSGVVTVPETAVVEQGGARVVRIVGADKAVRNVVVHPGLHQDGQVEVDGVSPGADVVVSGPPDLADGTVVEPRS
ncbi:MAG: efflux RND transporter periplasmic adaptor subunit [Alphaproteobacteria bacterium]|nr:efflux RND transporter periplasmic adaptor subunit [Alphaproteobacteria bacterium]